MHEIVFLAGISKNLEGDLIISFKVEDKPDILEEYKKLKEQELVLDVKKFRKTRSLDANAYFWQLCDKIAKKLGTDKDTIYLLMLQGAGKFVDVEIIKDAYEELERSYRLVEIRTEYERTRVMHDMTVTETVLLVRCYIGSHVYDSQEMADLINFTVNQAKDLGIETLTPEELSKIMALYEQNYAKKKL